jgi:methyl-accepting chemotaxis protein
MKIQAKLILLTLFIVVSFACVLMVFFISNQKSDQFLEKEQELTNLLLQWKEVNISTRELMTSTTDIATLKQEWSQSVERFESSLMEITESQLLRNLDEETKANLDNLENLWNHTQQYVVKIEESLNDYINSFDPSDTMRLLTAYGHYSATGNSMGQYYISSFITAVESFYNSESLFSDKLRGGVAKVNEVLNQRKTESFLLSLILSGAIIIAAFLITTLFSRRLVKKIQFLEQEVNTLAQKDFTVSIDTRGRDEIATLSSNLQDFVHNISNTLNRVKETTQQTVTLKEELSSATDQSAASLTDMGQKINSINERFTNLNQQIEDTSESIDTIANTINALLSQVENQSSAVNQSSASVEEMTSSISNVANTAVEKKEAGEKLIKRVQENREKMEEANNNIEDIANDIDNILEITRIIGDIANQTDMLSLNAAIESAHAGESGRGFAVVAEQIRDLAESTSNNAREISQTVQRVTEKFDLARQSSNESYQTFEEVDKQFSGHVTALEEIAQAMEELSSGGKEVLQATNQLSDSSNTILEGSKRIKKLSSTIHSSMKDASAISNQVLEELQEINSNIEAINKTMSDLDQLDQKNSESVQQLEEEIESFKT